MGKILRPHGVKGALRLRSFMENPRDIFEQACLDQAGHSYKLKLLFPDKDEFICEIKGITDRDAADKLKGLELSLSRDDLPEIKEEDTYYHSDLIGLLAKLQNGDEVGKIVAVHNFGAGTMLEIAGCTDYIPFQDPYVSEVNFEQGSVTIELPLYV